MKEKSKEDYLRTMCWLYEKLDSKEDGIASVNIAKELKITRSSV
jgi:Mn-dependent DtxR family transcriptional regulator